MNRTELAEALALMAALPFVGKPDNVADRATFEAYALTLSDLDFADVRDAVKRHLISSRFWPTVAELRESVFATLLRIPSVGVAVHEVSTTRVAGRVEDAPWSHALIRETVFDVRATRIHEEWSFAQREFTTTYERLRQIVIDAASMASMTGEWPLLPPRLAAIARGVDPLAPPLPPELEADERAQPWGFDEQRGEWRVLIEGPEGHRLKTEAPLYPANAPVLPDGRAPRARPARGVT